MPKDGSFKRAVRRHAAKSNKNYTQALATMRSDEFNAQSVLTGTAAPNIRVMVVTGVGRAFCAGIDVRRGGEAAEQTDGERQAPSLDQSRQGFYHVTTPHFPDISRTIRKPTVAMVNVVAVGMGMDISLHCDVRIGCENTRFLTYQGVGQIPENGALYHLPRIMGLGRAMEFLYTGSLDAKDAYRTGVLNKLIPSEKLGALDSSMEATMVMTSNASGILADSEDGREERQAFTERRDPVFRGR